jgi:hypothetical protein
MRANSGFLGDVMGLSPGGMSPPDAPIVLRDTVYAQPDSKTYYSNMRHFYLITFNYKHR